MKPFSRCHCSSTGKVFEKKSKIRKDPLAFERSLCHYIQTDTDIQSIFHSVVSCTLLALSPIRMRSLPYLATITVAALARAEMPSNEQLASYGLTLPEFELIKASESPYDLAHPDYEQLWLDAATFSYEISTSLANAHGVSSLSYMPYVVCNESPGSSGQERMKEIQDIFSNTSGVEASDFTELETAVTNGAFATCLLMRAYNDTIATIYAENPGVEEWLKVQPLHQSMKMNNRTVEIISERIDNIESGDYVMLDNPSTWFKYVNVIGSQSLLCPGVDNFGGVEVPDEDIETAAKDYIVGDNGNKIKDASFFHKRVNNIDASTNVTTDRMDMWAGIISDVDNMITKNGTNWCRETIIDDNTIFKMDKDNLNVVAKLSTDEMLKLAEIQNLNSEDLEKCTLYLAMGLALNPMICWFETKTQVKVLCPDGTSDLSKCPEPETEIENPESSSKNGGPTAILTVFVLLLSYFI